MMSKVYFPTQTDEEWALCKRIVKLLGWKDGEEIGANYPTYWYPTHGDPVHKSWNPPRDREEIVKVIIELIDNSSIDEFMHQLALVLNDDDEPFALRCLKASPYGLCLALLGTLDKFPINGRPVVSEETPRPEGMCEDCPGECCPCNPYTQWMHLEEMSWPTCTCDGPRSNPANCPVCSLDAETETEDRA